MYECSGTVPRGLYLEAAPPHTQSSCWPLGPLLQAREALPPNQYIAAVSAIAIGMSAAATSSPMERAFSVHVRAVTTPAASSQRKDLDRQYLP